MIFMKKHYTCILSVFIAILVISSSLSFAQVPDDINGRLWRLCKVWGFAKYYHENNCGVNWNNVLLTAIDSTLVTTSNVSFNATISELLAAAGQIPHATDPLVNDADINLNAHFDWMDDLSFGQDVRDNLDSILDNFRPKENCLVKFNDGSDPNFGGLLSFSNDNILNIPSFSYSVESNRLLALFYYWNIINYFHPDRDLMDQDWDSTLYQFIPLIREAQNDVEFHVRFLNLVTYLNDSHGFTSSSFITNYFGDFYPLIQIKYIENQTVITKVGPAISDISVGDIIKKIDGIDITIYRDSLAQFVTSSNESSLNRDLVYFLLRGSFASTFVLELVDSTGATYTTLLNRKYSSQIYYDWMNPADTNPIWEITQCGYGYVNMGKLTNDQIPEMYDQLKDTPAIIFDIRNYPNGTLWILVPYFYTENNTWALFTVPDFTFPGWYKWADNQFAAGTFSNPNHYGGKVILLVNAITQSQAEYTVMGLQQHTYSYTIGSQTAGADGNISYLTLPGSLRTYWTSLGVYYPDTTTAQRVGVRIDSIVTPTIEGIRRGKDEVLEAAFDCLTSLQNEVTAIPEFTLYPNPADDVIYISLDFGQRNKLVLEAFNLIGQKVLQRSIQVNGINHIPIDIAHWMNGIYIVTISDENGIFGSEKIQVQH